MSDDDDFLNELAKELGAASHPEPAPVKPKKSHHAKRKPKVEAEPAPPAEPRVSPVVIEDFVPSAPAPAVEIEISTEAQEAQAEDPFAALPPHIRERTLAEMAAGREAVANQKGRR